jgi:hypothetical protein
MTISITSPPPPPPPPALTDVDANKNPFAVSGTNTASNSVDGTLTDESSSNIYHPVSGGTLGPGGAWTLNFDTGNSIELRDTLCVHVYDIHTFISANVTYLQGSFSPEDMKSKGLVAAASATVTVPASIGTEGVWDIPVSVTTPSKTKGFVFLTLRTKGGPGTSSKIVLSSRLSPSGTTNYIFPAIDMSYWDFVFVNALVVGGDVSEPVILKPQTT